MRLRLEVLEALVLATEHRGDVLDAVAEARDPVEARRSVALLLGIGENSPAAQAVVDVRLRLFSQSEIAQLRSEIELIRGRLDRAP